MAENQMLPDGLRQRLAMAEAQRNWYAGQLQFQQLEHETNVMLPLQARQAQLQIEQAERDAAKQAMQDGLERQRLHNQAMTQRQIAGLQQRFMTANPSDRYENLGNYAQAARTLRDMKPSEDTQAAFEQFATYHIQAELYGRPIQQQTQQLQQAPEPTKRYRQVGIKFGGVEQVKDEKTGRFVPASTVDLNETLEPASPSNYAKPVMPQAQPIPEINQVPPTPEENIQRAQKLLKQYDGNPALIEPIRAYIQEQENTPQMWAKRVGVFDLPDGPGWGGVKNIIAKAESGGRIHPDEQRIVDTAISQYLQQAFAPKKEEAPQSNYRAPVAADVINGFEELPKPAQDRWRRLRPDLFGDAQAPSAPSGPASGSEFINSLR